MAAENVLNQEVHGLSSRGQLRKQDKVYCLRKTVDHGQDGGATGRCRKPSNKIHSNVGPSLDRETVESPAGGWVEVFPQAHTGQAAMKDLMFWDIEGHQNRCLTTRRVWV